MALHTEVGEHSGQDDLVLVALAELQDEIVGLRPPHFVRADHHRLAVFDEGLITLKPVGPGADKSIEAERIGTDEALDCQARGCRPLKSPQSANEQNAHECLRRWPPLDPFDTEKTKVFGKT